LRRLLFSANSNPFTLMNCPADLLYTPSHEWVRLENSAATVGVTDHAQRELTDVVYVELPSVGKHYAAGQPLCVIESVKAASDIYAPLSGTVEAVNSELSANPALINTDPYGAGWIFRLVADPGTATDTLLAAADYARQIPPSDPS
jgi:glycine cleavage system H protein